MLHAWGEALLESKRTVTDRRQYHNEGVLKKYQPKLKIGEVQEKANL